MTKNHMSNPRATREMRNAAQVVGRAERIEAKRNGGKTVLEAAIAAQGSEGERAFATQLRQINAPPWVPELVFYPARKWRFDFAWPELLVAVEIEGGTWSGGRHSGGSGFEADCLKYAEAGILGWLVLRVTTAMVEDGRAVQLLGRALWARSRR